MPARKKPARDASPRTPLVIHMDPTFATVAIARLDAAIPKHTKEGPCDCSTCSGDTNAKDTDAVLGLVRDAIRDGIVARLRGDR